MTTATTVYETAMRLAASGTETDEAVEEILNCCGDKRVSVVLARQQLVEGLSTAADERVAVRAAELLDHTLERLPSG